MKIYIKHDKNWAKSILSQYPQDVVDFIKEFKDIVDNTIVLESQDDDFVEISNEDEIDNLYWQYRTIAANEGAIEDYSEFDNIYEALCILE